VTTAGFHAAVTPPSVSSIPSDSPSAHEATSDEGFPVDDEGESKASPGLGGTAKKPRLRQQSTTKRPECDDDKVRHRRNRRRLNQARYRCKQQAKATQLGLHVDLLRQEIRRLKRMHRESVLDTTLHQNSGTLVAKMFVLLETTFRSPWNMRTLHALETSLPLSTAFRGDVQVGDVYGINALEQQRCLWRHFDAPDIRFDRVDAAAPSVLAATAKERLHSLEESCNRQTQAQAPCWPAAAVQMLVHFPLRREEWPRGAS
jgi:hypothetical protein